MSAEQQGPGWWMASDGRWYPPETRPVGWAPIVESRRRTSPIAWVGLGLVVAIALIVLGVYAIGSTVDTDPTIGRDVGAGEFTTTVNRFAPENPSSLMVFASITNTGSRGLAECRIEATDSSGTYTGSGDFVGKWVDAGATVDFVGSVPVSNEGARWISEVTLTC